MKVTDEQKQLILGAIVGAVLLLVGQVAHILSGVPAQPQPAPAPIIVQPAPQPAPVIVPQPGPVATAGPVDVLALGGGISCKPSPNPCIDDPYGRGAYLGGWLAIAPETRLVVTNAVFIATGSYQPISATVAVTPTIFTATAVAGEMLLLVNIGSNNITLVDGGAQVLSADFVMGQYDTLAVIFDGTRWIERARSNN